MIRFMLVKNIPKLHETPLASIRIESPQIILEVDDEDERRMRLRFETYQAVRLVTADCLELPNRLSVVPGTVVEVTNSPWIEELKRAALRNDEQATFMEKARHFFIPLQDDFLEVVAWDITVLKE